MAIPDPAAGTECMVARENLVVEKPEPAGGNAWVFSTTPYTFTDNLTLPNFSGPYCSEWGDLNGFCSLQMKPVSGTKKQKC